MDDIVKNIRNLKKFIQKNHDFIELIVVSKDFMIKLKQIAGEVDFEQRFIYDAEEKEDIEVWYLFGVPVVYNNSLKYGCIIEDSNHDTIVFEDF